MKSYDRASLPQDLMAALGVTLLAIPQGVAYALIAGLPPAMGLYAATLPALIGALFRSSRHVITGPTNAVSLLVGTAVAAHVGGSPTEIALTLALMVGGMQIAAGFLRLGGLVYYISTPVVLGYITGAGLLIGIGQLGNVTGTHAQGENGALKLWDWAHTIGDAHTLPIAVALTTIATIVIIRKINRRLPAALMAIFVSIAASAALNLRGMGLKVVADVGPIPSGLPVLTLPNLALAPELLSLAVAVTVLCLVESTSIARSIARSSGQRLDLSWEIAGEGLANVSAAFLGAYPVTGSLSRSALNVRDGATSRLSGIISGLAVLALIPLIGPLLNYIPVASLAGLLLVVAVGLIDTKHIKLVQKSHWGDRFAFFGTVLGTLVLHLDQAVYVGVIISLVMFLRRARMLSLRDLVIDGSGRLREVSSRKRQIVNGHFHQPDVAYCHGVHVINVAGSLFFGSSGELQTALDELARMPDIKAIIVRLKRARNLDVSAYEVLAASATSLREQGKRLYLVGMTPSALGYLQRLGLDETIGVENTFHTRPDHWFVALEDAMSAALDFAGPHGDGPCVFQKWLETRGVA